MFELGNLLQRGAHDRETRRLWLAEALADLTEREMIIIRERRLVEEGVTLETLGRKLGVSKERVRQIQMEALSKLRKRIAQDGLSPDSLL